MNTVIKNSYRFSLQLAVAALLFAAPVGAFALNSNGSTSMGKGAGLVLYVALERNAMR